MQNGKRPSQKHVTSISQQVPSQGLSASPVRPYQVSVLEPRSVIPGVSNLRHARQMCSSKHTSCLRNTFWCPLEIRLGFCLCPCDQQAWYMNSTHGARLDSSGEVYCTGNPINRLGGSIIKPSMRFLKGKVHINLDLSIRECIHSEHLLGPKYAKPDYSHNTKHHQEEP